MTAIKLPSGFDARIEKASKVLGIVSKELIIKLEKLGIEMNEMGFQLLDSNVTTTDYLVSELKSVSTSELKKRAAAFILKGLDPFSRMEEKTENINDGTVASAVIEAIKSQREIKHLKDRELLELYDKERDYEAEKELHRRANSQAFIILKPGDQTPGNEKIDIELSLDLLKLARKSKTPEMVPVGDTIVPLFKVIELNILDRIVEICPICGETLYKGYCSKCQVNLSPINEDERAFIRLVLEEGSLNKTVYADRKAIIDIAKTGLAQMKATWPKTSKKFDELKIINDLPKLRIMRSTPSILKDPFYVAK